MRNRFVIGTRGSELALWQANLLKTRLEESSPGTTFEIRTIKTTGDELTDVALSKIGDKGLFTKQIEAELLRGGVDFAVHSLKDLQTAQPDGLVIGCVLSREVPNDAFISTKHRSMADLPKGARVATGSLRRRSQLLHYRADLSIAEMRGNVPTRLKKFDESKLDAMILAYAGLHRLGLDERVRELIPFEIMLPAVGQGAVAVEIRSDDKAAAEITSALDDRETRICVTAERAFLRRLEGGCQVPIGALAVFNGGKLMLDGMLGDLEGAVLRASIAGEPGNAERLGTELAELLIARGGAELLASARADAATAVEKVI